MVEHESILLFLVNLGHREATCGRHGAHEAREITEAHLLLLILNFRGQHVLHRIQHAHHRI